MDGWAVGWACWWQGEEGREAVGWLLTPATEGVGLLSLGPLIWCYEDIIMSCFAADSLKTYCSEPEGRRQQLFRAKMCGLV